MKKKPRTKAIEHRVENVTIEFTQRGEKRRLLRVQRYRKPIQIKDIDYSKNPEKLSFVVLRNKYGDRLELFMYQNNPEKAFFSLNGEVIGLTKWEWGKLMSALYKWGKKIGRLK